MKGIAENKKTYEERVYDLVQGFTTSDITRIIDAKVEAAGLIIMPALAGMIAFGHSLYGYDLENRAAFLKFTRYRMKLDRGLSEILYDNVYTGLTQMWCSEVRIVLHSRFRDGMDGPIWYRDRREDPQRIHISALEIAKLYLEIAQKLPEYNKTPQHKDHDREATQILRDQVEAFCSAGRVQDGGAVWQ